MKRKITRLTITTFALIAIVTPLFAQPGSADFSRYVALGDSLTVGVSNFSVVESHQQWSFPQILSRQAGFGPLEQPLISEPGIPIELALVSLQPLVIAPKANEFGSPTNLDLPRPYDNLGIWAARASQLLTRDGSEEDELPFFAITLRGIGTAVEQAIALDPTFITLWVGSNDVLGAVRFGTLDQLTSLEEFSTAYPTIVAALRTNAPGAGMVTATIPPVTAVPYLTTIPPLLIDPATNQPAIGPDGNPIFFVAEFGDGSIGQLVPGSFVTLLAQPLLSTGYGIPGVLAPLFPGLPDVGKPLPDSVVVDPAEFVAIEERRAQFNEIIRTTAAAAGIPVLDSDAAFARFAAGVEFAGITINTDFLTGGLISLDGFHPTDIGYTLIANEFIRVINEAYGSNIPYASLVPFFANNAPPEASGMPDTSIASMLAVPWSGFELDMSFGSLDDFLAEEEEEEEEEPAPRRRRGAGR